MNHKFVAGTLLLSMTLGMGCMRRTATQNARPTRQTEGAFDPLSADQHVQQLQARLKADKQDVSARLELGAVYENYRLYDNAFDQYMNAMRQLRAGDSLAERAALGLGRSARALHRTAEAISVVESVARQRPTANSYSELGLLYEEKGDLPAAESAFEQAVAANPESDSSHNNLGYNLLVQGRTEEAETEFRKALDLKPASTTARNNLATVLARRGDLQGALEQFQVAADAATAHNNLAVVLLEMGQYEQSREQLVQALTIRRNFAPALINFKLAQERIREKTLEDADARKFGRLPLNTDRRLSTLAALEKMIPLVGASGSEDQHGIAALTDPEDGQ